MVDKKNEIGKEQKTDSISAGKKASYNKPLPPLAKDPTNAVLHKDNASVSKHTEKSIPTVKKKPVSSGTANPITAKDSEKKPSTPTANMQVKASDKASTEVVRDNTTQNKITAPNKNKPRKTEGALRLIDSFIGVAFGKGNGKGAEDVYIASRAPIMFGVAVIAITFGVFGLWSMIAPIDSAAVASGYIEVESNKKVIQHLEGGIIDEILVSEGDLVAEGQALIKLSRTTAEAQQGILTGQLRVAKATEARLIAERDLLDEVTFPPFLERMRDDKDVAEILDSQLRLFDTRRSSLKGKVGIYRQRIKQLKDEITGLQAQKSSTTDQLRFVREEIGVVTQLLKEGIASKPRLLALKRQEASLKGNHGEYTALIAKAKQSITEAELEIKNAHTVFLNEVIEELKTVQDKIADVDERVRASSDVLERIEITAPQDGIITGLNFHTVGGVIAPGAEIMNIVPQDDALVISARISPQDIDIVHKGLKARVRLTVFKVRKVPIMNGEVVNVSADRFIDEITGIPYYKARVVIDEESLKKLEDVELYPGMPADVLIVTGSRTFLSYLMSPITDSVNKAFREQ